MSHFRPLFLSSMNLNRFRWSSKYTRTDLYLTLICVVFPSATLSQFFWDKYLRRGRFVFTKFFYRFWDGVSSWGFYQFPAHRKRLALPFQYLCRVLTCSTANMVSTIFWNPRYYQPIPLLICKKRHLSCLKFATWRVQVVRKIKWGVFHVHIRSSEESLVNIYKRSWPQQHSESLKCRNPTLHDFWCELIFYSFLLYSSLSIQTG